MNEKPETIASAHGLPFTDKARHAIERANRVRERLGHKWLSGEHLLLGMTEGECLANHVLGRAGIDHARVAGRIRQVLAILEPAQLPQGTKVVELAVESAKEMGNDYIGTEHLLLGLIKERNGLAGAILRETLTTESLLATIRACHITAQ